MIKTGSNFIRSKLFTPRDKNPHLNLDSTVGIGTTSPAEALDVSGGIRAGASTAVTETCGSGEANHEGTQRYNYATHNMEYCNGTAWVTVGVGSVTPGTICGLGCQGACGSVSYVTCNGVSVISSCPSGYTQNLYSWGADSNWIVTCVHN